MTDLIVTTETVYSITGLTFDDVVMLCLGLDAIRGDTPQPMLDRNIELVKAMEHKLPDVKATTKE